MRISETTERTFTFDNAPKGWELVDLISSAQLDDWKLAGIEVNENQIGSGYVYKAVFRK